MPLNYNTIVLDPMSQFPPPESGEVARALEMNPRALTIGGGEESCYIYIYTHTLHITDICEMILRGLIFWSLNVN